MPAKSSSFRFALRSSWALLLGFGILMLGDGLQGTLLAVRANQEGYSATTTGLIMSTFYAGFLFGSMMTPRITANVGHIRVFAALAALASASILVHAIFVQVPVWLVLRFISGFCFAGLYIVAESWLNDRATNETRGKLLSLYMVVSYVGVGAGQLLLNLGSPTEFPLFILTSVLISVAVVPLLLSAGSPPEFHRAVNIKLLELIRLSPLGMVGMFGVGLVTATFFALGPVYSQRLGLNIENTSYFMASAVLGTVILQGPIGVLSDHFDRRIILTLVTFLTALSAFLVPLMQDSTQWLMITAGLFGGLAFPLYSVCIAHTNDRLDPTQMVAASGALVMIGGIGAVVGPVLVALIMDFAGNDAFFWSMGVVHGIIALFALYRMTRSKSIPIGQQRPVAPAAARPGDYAVDGMQQYVYDESVSESEKTKPETDRVD